MRAKRLFWVPVLATGLVVAGCTAEKTQDGEMPEVNVEGGQLPKYDVDAADVTVTTDTQTVVVPDVEVTPPSN